MTEYEKFLEKKQHSQINYGIDVNFIPGKMFDFQKYILEYAVKKSIKFNKPTITA
jgi:hypothetical protein